MPTYQNGKVVGVTHCDVCQGKGILVKTYEPTKPVECEKTHAYTTTYPTVQTGIKFFVNGVDIAPVVYERLTYFYNAGWVAYNFDLPDSNLKVKFDEAYVNGSGHVVARLHFYTDSTDPIRLVYENEMGNGSLHLYDDTDVTVATGSVMLSCCLVKSATVPSVPEQLRPIPDPEPPSPKDPEPPPEPVPPAPVEPDPQPPVTPDPEPEIIQYTLMVDGLDMGTVNSIRNNDIVALIRNSGFMAYIDEDRYLTIENHRAEGGARTISLMHKYDTAPVQEVNDTRAVIDRYMVSAFNIRLAGKETLAKDF